MGAGRGVSISLTAVGEGPESPASSSPLPRKQEVLLFQAPLRSSM